MTFIDEDERKQIQEHIRTLEYVFDELSTQHIEINERMERLSKLINKEKAKLKND